MTTQPTPPDPTHYACLPGKSRTRRTALCGAQTSVRGFDRDELGFAGGCSRIEHVDCPACLRLAELAVAS